MIETLLLTASLISGSGLTSPNTNLQQEQENSGSPIAVVSVHSYYGKSDGNLGHSFLTVSNYSSVRFALGPTYVKPNETVTVGKWLTNPYATSFYNGLMFNFESSLYLKGRLPNYPIYSYSFNVYSLELLANFSAYLGSQTDVGFTEFNTCATFTTNAMNVLLDDTVDLPYTFLPRELIENLTYRFGDQVVTNFRLSGTTSYYYYRYGVRTIGLVK